MDGLIERAIERSDVCYRAGNFVASHGCLIYRSEHDFVRIDEDVLRRVRVADDVVQATSMTAVDERVELFDRDAALVFDDALQSAVNVAHAGHDAAAELVVISHHELVGVLHACARGERFATAYETACRNGNSARGVVEEVS